MARAAMTIALISSLSTAVYAHDGVKNAEVKERMALMKEVKAATGTIGDMAKSTTPFDPTKAAEARARLIAAATQMPKVFAAPETDPKSEALPMIWHDWNDFVAQSRAMGAAARQLDTGSLASLRNGLDPIGQSCSSCHERYRAKK